MEKEERDDDDEDDSPKVDELGGENGCLMGDTLVEKVIGYGRGGSSYVAVSEDGEIVAFDVQEGEDDIWQRC